MVFWHRINQSKLKYLSHQLKRYYVQIPYDSSSLNYAATHTRACVSEQPYWGIHKRPTDFCNNVRFFAAPIQAKPKTNEKDTSGPRLNDQIQAQFVRLVTEQGHNVVSRHAALEHARKLKLDLVEVQRYADPPVCKIMDFHKEKYVQKVKEKDRAKNKSEVRKGDYKEVRFSGKTEQKDLKMKADMVKRLMDRGYRVKCVAMGTEDQELGELLSRLAALIEDVSVVESGPRVEKKQAYVIVRHIKFGLSKKGGVRKLKVVGDKSASPAPPAVNFSGHVQRPALSEDDPAESGSETEDEIQTEMLNNNIEDNKTAWSVIESSDDFNEVFDFSDGAKVATSNSTVRETHAVPETAPSSTNYNDSNILRAKVSKLVPDSTRADALPSSPLGSSLRTENRYKSSEPKNQFPTIKSMDNKGPGMRDSIRLEPQSLNHRRQPSSDMNFSHTLRETKQVRTDASVFRNLKLPPHDIPKQEPSRPDVPGTPAPSYGIFSNPKTSALGKQGVAADGRGNKEGSPYDTPSRNPGTEGVGANQNFPGLKSDVSQGPGLDKGGPGKWGIFSRQGSNVMLNKISKTN